MPQENLFSAFKDYSIEDWKSIILKDLKGGTYESLVTHTPEGIDIEPIYHGDKKELTNFFNPIQTANEALAVRNWVNNTFIKVRKESEANTLALDALNSGADGIIFEVSKEVNLNVLLKNIKPGYCSISFSSSSFEPSIIQKYIEFLKVEEQDLQTISGNYLTDALELRDGGSYDLEEKIFQQISESIKLTEEIPQFKCLHISSKLFHNAGSNNVHELAFLLSKTVEYFDKLTEAGVSIKTIANSLVFSVAFGSNYFFEIAKVKALRKLIHKIFSAYDVEVVPSKIKIIGYTSQRTKSALDFNVNLLRNTTEAMAAILGGCNELYISPHDEAVTNESKPTFKRIALNISNILKEEAHLDKTADPTMGSYYLETLIQEFIKKSWDNFLAYEKEGSYSELFEKGFVKSIISKDDQLSADAVLSRKAIYIGANMYQNIGEKLFLTKTQEQNGPYLQEKRVGWKVENLRARTENHVNKHEEAARPTATIISFGTDPVSKAKLDFAYSFLGMAGIKIIEEIILKDFEKLETILASQKSSLIVYCYKDLPPFSAHHFQHKTAKIMIAGQEEKEQDFKANGLYACIHRKVEAYSFLDNLLNDLNIEE